MTDTEIENKKPIILIWHVTMRIGGIETMVVRISNWLVEHGYVVRIIVREGGDLQSLLDPKVEVRITNNFSVLLKNLTMSNSIRSDRFFCNIDVILTLDPQTLWLSCLVYQTLGRHLQLFTGVYHSRAYYMTAASKVLVVLFRDYLNDESKIFMNKEVMAANEERMGRIFKRANIIPIPIDGARFANIQRRPKKFKIVSIGRLIRFKSYNLYMIDVIKALIDKGYDVTWDIFGSGALAEEMKRKICACNLNQVICLKGNVNYDAFIKTLEDAYLFVGMGTALMEAAYCKVPSIAATADAPDIMAPYSHGYVYSLPDFNCGEYSRDLRIYKVQDLIENLFLMSEENYQDECKRSFEHAKRFNISSVMNAFLEVLLSKVDNSKTIKFPKYKFVLICVQMELRRISSQLKFWIRSVMERGEGGT